MKALTFAVALLLALLALTVHAGETSVPPACSTSTAAPYVVVPMTASCPVVFRG